ncbi:cell division protein ZapC domain-containing protein [Aliiglaciecola sp. LCG003]|uniref:cell division protein ZapC domain-containing protein n=1 Tax=Aliiglaciecola sp. LCG003 TaxID=3053655 RepID=UPI002573FBFF|nr:cell division protein ZapC domain-containing protein [Aliiglaciecola sp. LCG003]WJG07649.1 cell division protein ZapC [Aliiglaciecola sp. LCG003]
MLLPSGKWKWFIDQASSSLLVELDAGLTFQTAYQVSQLKVSPDGLFFDIEHSDYFIQCIDALDESGVPFDDSIKMQIAINASAARCFHKPVLNKSWLYTKQNLCLIDDQQQLAWISHNQETYLVMTLERKGDTVLCMNLSEQFVTSDHKIHPQFSLLSVLSDRLLAFDQLGENEEEGQYEDALNSQTSVTKVNSMY